MNANKLYEDQRQYRMAQALRANADDKSYERKKADDTEGGDCD